MRPIKRLYPNILGLLAKYSTRCGVNVICRGYRIFSGSGKIPPFQWDKPANE